MVSSELCRAPVRRVEHDGPVAAQALAGEDGRAVQAAAEQPIRLGEARWETSRSSPGSKGPRRSKARRMYRPIVVLGVARAYGAVRRHAVKIFSMTRPADRGAMSLVFAEGVDVALGQLAGVEHPVRGHAERRVHGARIVGARARGVAATQPANRRRHVAQLLELGVEPAEDA